MKLRIGVQLSIIVAGICGGVLAHLVDLYFLSPFPFSEEIIHGISSQNIKEVVFIIGLSLQLLMSLFLGALVPALLVGFKQHSSVFLASRLYSLGMLFIVTIVWLGQLMSSRHASLLLSVYIAQVIVLFFASYAMVWLGASAARLTLRSRGTPQKRGAP
ncbi:MAG: hypothetical protein B7Y56_15865 [Gallionellales bacterium 35-53-114]|jgi:hypothetical protein|nr:MAG: hypothetical protein B7Y56_15865 [Gallionellales bacterium 35-53-114]HQS60024.1 hypothetical protein [Gallionellaceae bacterium]